MQRETDLLGVGPERSTGRAQHQQGLQEYLASAGGPSLCRVVEVTTMRGYLATQILRFPSPKIHSSFW